LDCCAATTLALRASTHTAPIASRSVGRCAVDVEYAMRTRISSIGYVSMTAATPEDAPQTKNRPGVA